jgi:hypothetical protein
MAYTTTKLVADEEIFTKAITLAGTNLGKVSAHIIAWKKLANTRLLTYNAASTTTVAKGDVTTE